MLQTIIRYILRLSVSQDFDLCISCKEKDGHPHHMEKLGLDLDDGSSPADAKQANPQVKIYFCEKKLGYPLLRIFITYVHILILINRRRANFRYRDVFSHWYTRVSVGMLIVV